MSSRPPAALALIGRELRARLAELPLWLGVPIIGAAYGGDVVAPRDAGLWLGGQLCLALHLLFFNDWAGIVINPGELKRLGIDPGAAVDPTPLLRFALISLAAGVALLGFVDVRLGTLAVIWGALSGAYSHPRPRLKESLPGSAAIHLLAGEVLFVSGYLLTGEVVTQGAAVGIFFALLLVAGNLNHQAVDVSEDSGGGLRTAAVRFGAAASATGSAFVFVVAVSFAGALYAGGWLDVRFVACFTPAVIVPLGLILWRALRGGEALTRRVLRRYRMLYRLGFGAGAAAFVASAAWDRVP